MDVVIKVYKYGLSGSLEQCASCDEAIKSQNVIWFISSLKYGFCFPKQWSLPIYPPI